MWHPVASGLQLVDAQLVLAFASDLMASPEVYKTSRFKSTNFAVAHYAGEVVYDVGA